MPTVVAAKGGMAVARSLGLLLVCSLLGASPDAAEAAPAAGKPWYRRGFSRSVGPASADASLPVPVLPAAVEADGPVYPVTNVLLEYGLEHPALPALDTILPAGVELAPVADGYAKPRAGLAVERVPLVAPAGALRSFHASAVKAINEAVVQEFNRRNIVGVYAAPHSEDLNPKTLKDLRQGRTTLRIVVRVSVVNQVRTVAAGARFTDPASRLNNPHHDRIARNSPVQPGAAPGDPARTSLLRRDLTNDYALRLGRHPGRRVDVALAAAETPGDAVLDYIVTENRPWLAYVQVSNNGTETTNEWRERAGFIHNQLFGIDDILTLDYVTAGFGEDANAVALSYEAPPIPSFDRLRLRLYGSWSDFAATEVGTGLEDFTGAGWQVGGEASYGVFQARETFVDAFLGARVQRVTNTNETLDEEGESDFFLPYLGLRVARQTDSSVSGLAVSVEHNFPGVMNTAEPAELQKLGRLGTDEEWTALLWDASQSFYLDALYAQLRGAKPEQSSRAHEVSLRCRGQEVFGDQRVSPQFERTAGGFFSVRGYPESVAAGDNGVLCTGEYLLHVPRLLRIAPDRPKPFGNRVLGRQFRFVPDEAFGPTDWDLIVRLFVDGGRVSVNGDSAIEAAHNLFSAGVGMELQLFRNLNLRCDVGQVITPVQDWLGNALEGADRGDRRLHVMATVLW